MRGLLVIDYTQDFVASDGKLTCGRPAQLIENRIATIVQEFLDKGDFIVMAVDCHQEGDKFHPENSLFPPHNLKGSQGRDLYGQLNDVYQKNKEKIYWMDKTRYSAFAGTDLELQLRVRGITEVHLTGVCTDICILHTAVDLYNKGFAIVVHKDGVQSFNETGHNWALTHFETALGAKVI